MIQETAEATGNLIGNENADKITRVSNKYLRTNEKEILRERFIPSELRQKIINDVRLKEENIDYSKINIITI